MAACLKKRAREKREAISLRMEEAVVLDSPTSRREHSHVEIHTARGDDAADCRALFC